MKQYTLEYKNTGTVKVISTVCADDLEDLQTQISDGTLNPEIQDIEFENPEGEYTVLDEVEIPEGKINPIQYPEGTFMNPPES